MKKLIAFAALAVSCLAVQAGVTLQLRHSAGVHSMPLEKVSEVVFTENGVQARLTDNSVYSVNGLNNFVSVRIADDAAGVTDVAADAESAIAYDGKTLRASAPVKVYNLAGVLVAESAEGVLDMQNQPAGAYVASAAGKTLKIVKQ